MKNNYEIQYQKIVGDFSATRYETPEEQGKAIRKCSILKNIEIEYNPVDRTQSNKLDA